ncbi:MAG: AtpZ/AtpI family protein [Thermodesulfobacteriota bacterium]
MGFGYNRNRAWLENLSIVMQIGLTMAGCILFCFFLGRYIDKWVGTRGVFVTVFIIFGIVGGAGTTYRQILEITEGKKDGEQKSPKNTD